MLYRSQLVENSMNHQVDGILTFLPKSLVLPQQHLLLILETNMNNY